MAAREIDILINYIVDSDPLREVNREMNSLASQSDAVTTASSGMARQYNHNIDSMSHSHNNLTHSIMASTAALRTFGPLQQGNVPNMRQQGAERYGEIPDFRTMPSPASNRNYYSERLARWRAEQALISVESRRMLREMRTGWMSLGPAFGLALNAMIRAEYGFFRLAQQGQNYARSTREFFGELTDLGNAMKHANEDMINADTRLRQSMYQTAAEMSVMTTQAVRIRQNYDRLRNPLYLVNAGNLAIADSLNRIANNATPAMLALKMLGPQASNYQLYNMIQMITQGLMRMAYASIGAAVVSFFLYRALHQAAMGSEEYETAFTDMVAALRGAVQPMVEAFIAVMIPVYRFITYLAELVIAFNDAHPVLARFIQGVIMLVPLLTLILSPLAAGIGLWYGYAAAFGALWVWIGPAITAFGAMSATVWVVAAAIVALTMYLSHLWKTNEGFRDGLIEIWETIKTGVGTAIDFITEKAGSFMGIVKDAINGDTKAIEQIFANLLPTILGFLVGGFPALLMMFFRFFPDAGKAMESGAGALVPIIQNVFTMITSFITNQLPTILQMGVEILTNLINGIVQALPALATTVVMLIQSLLIALSQALPMVLQAGVTILMALIEGIMMVLPALVPVVMEFINTLVTTIATLLPTLIETGIQILMTLIEGIVQMLPMIIDTAINLITTLLTTIVTLLPTILQAGVQILLSLINGIIQILPNLITTAFTLIATLAAAIINNLPAILAAGVQILTALINGIISMIGNLLSTGADLINQLKAKFEEVSLVDVGKNIIQGLINGIGSMVDGAISAAKKVAGAVQDTITGFFDMHSPSVLMKQDGAFITQGLAIGMENDIPMAQKAANNVSEATYGAVQPQGIGEGTSTTNNNGGTKNVFAPVLQLSGVGSDVKSQVDDALEEAFGMFNEQFGGY